jgi:hypothetical protein
VIWTSPPVSPVLFRLVHASADAEDAAGRGAGYAAVAAPHRDGRLTVTVENDGQGRSVSMTEIADRVGALDGILTVEPTWMGVEIPCG